MHKSGAKKGLKEQAKSGDLNKELFHERRAIFVPLGRAFNHKRAAESERKFKNHGGTVVQLNTCKFIIIFILNLVKEDNFRDLLKKIDYFLTAKTQNQELDLEKISEVLKLTQESLSKFVLENKHLHLRFLEHHFIDDCIKDNKIHHVKDFLIDIPKEIKREIENEEVKEHQTPAKSEKAQEELDLMITPKTQNKKRTKQQATSAIKDKGSSMKDETTEQQSTHYDEHEAELAAAMGDDYLKRRRLDKFMGSEEKKLHGSIDSSEIKSQHIRSTITPEKIHYDQCIQTGAIDQELNNPGADMQDQKPIKEGSIEGANEVQISEFSIMNQEDINQLDKVVDQIAKKEIQAINQDINEPIINHLQNIVDNLSVQDMSRSIYQDAIESIKNMNKALISTQDLFQFPSIEERVRDDIQRFMEASKNMIQQFNPEFNMLEELEQKQNMLQNQDQQQIQSNALPQAGIKSISEDKDTIQE
ncbi:UNKNOWN [Stylonychia lemnae]|uniref:Uncharacterized protein n=1 Tax=Stylonychia lemnae TaxID=5949 RepID=A0A078AGJ2_STYLE|nr:UNKNOWN [Stylonychia lemnae]|eukprot:CDW80657.1 UNKNOWN [Stylonychia lemnae]